MTRYGNERKHGMSGKKVHDSIVVMAQQMNPQDANPAGNVHGGVIMKLIDTAAGAAAMRHARTNAVTASIERLDFHNPVFVGDLVTVTASLNLAGRTSMEVGVRVDSENLVSGIIRHTASAYLTFVSLDPSGRPSAIPPLIFKTEDEVRRNREAQDRRQARILEKEKERSQQSGKVDS